MPGDLRCEPLPALPDDVAVLWVQLDEQRPSSGPCRCDQLLRWVRDRILLDVRGPLRAELSQEAVDLAGVEAAQGEVDIRGLQLLEDAGQHALVPFRDLAE